jgi:succinate dehydrogenase / fumarate reductase cytochrome b subunit
LPVSAYILNILFESQSSYLLFIDTFNSSIFLRTFVLFNIIIFEYHVITGLRHMLMDFHLINETLAASNTSAIVVLVAFTLNALLTIWLLI